LTVGLTRSPYTEALFDGSVRPEGIELKIQTRFGDGLDNVGARHRAIIAGEIDGGEVSISSYILARLRGVPLIALPVFLSRRFRLRCMAFVRGDLDYSAAVNGIIQGIVRGAPAKILACAVDRPLQSFIARKDIRAPRDLKGKKVAGSTTGGTATLMADAALKHFGLDPGRDVTVVTLRDNRLTAMESGTVDAALLGVPENIIAVEKGYNELLFLGDVLSFPQNGFGASVKKIQESPDEVYGMVRATLRGFIFSLDPRNREEVINIIMKQWRLTERRLAGEILKQFGRGIIRDMSIKPEGMQLMIDLVREDSKVAQPFSASQIVDFSFLERARRELGVMKQ